MELFGWAIIALVVSVAAGILGYTGIAAGAATIAKVLFAVFMAIFVVIVLMIVLGISIVA
jgi:uncharacterized membrane protein YtjA (UPF0391 family)